MCVFFFFFFGGGLNLGLIDHAILNNQMRKYWSNYFPDH